MPSARPIQAGERFTRWTVLEPAGRNTRGEAVYLCRCDCGTEKACTMGGLRHGSTKSCGCLMRERVSQVHAKPVHAGERFGRWVAVANSVRTKGASPMAVVICRCDCGTERTVQVASLRTGRSSSCGCRNLEIRSAPMVAGERFGRLAVVAFVARPEKKSGRPGEARYQFICDCGKTITARMSHVRSGNVKSCGCLARETSSITGQRMVRGGLAATKRFEYRSGRRVVTMRSSWEVAIAHHLDSQGRAWKYEPKCFVLSPEVRYTPDFYIPAEDLWIEVKGIRQKGFDAKRAMFEAGHQLVLVDAETLEKWTGLNKWRVYKKYPPMRRKPAKSLSI